MNKKREQDEKNRKQRELTKMFDYDGKSLNKQNKTKQNKKKRNNITTY